MFDQQSNSRAKTNRRQFLAQSGAGLSLPLLGALPAPAYADEASLAQAAKAEGRVTFYSVVPQAAAQGFIDGFKKKYALDMDYQRLTSGPLVQRYVAELQAGTVTADALAVTDNFFFDDAAEKGWLAPVADVPATAAYPAQFRDRTSATVQLLPHVLAYNTQAMSAAPTGWDTMADPKWKGRLILIDPRNGFFSSVWYYELRRKYGNDFLKALLKQEPTFVQSAVQGMQQLAAGAAALCGPSFPNLLLELKSKGAPVEIVAVEPTIAAGVYAGVPAKAPHPNAARLLMHYLMSPDGQALYNQGAVAPLGQLPGTLPLPKIADADLKAARDAQKDIFAALGF